MQLNKKISALFSCILACSAIYPVSAKAATKYEETGYDDEDEVDGEVEDDTAESSSINVEMINSGWMKPLLCVLVGSGLAYGGYTGVKAGKRYHARNMFTGNAWEMFMSNSDKKLIYDTVEQIKTFSVSASYEGISDSILNYNDNLKNNEDYRKLEFNLLKLYIFDFNFILSIGNAMEDQIAQNNFWDRIKLVYQLFTNGKTAEKQSLEELKKHSDNAVVCMNEILNGKKKIPNLNDNNKQLLEKNKKIIEFIDKIGPKDCTELLRHCDNIQTGDAGNNKLEIKWYKNGSNMNEDPYRTLTFGDPDIQPIHMA